MLPRDQNQSNVVTLGSIFAKLNTQERKYPQLGADAEAAILRSRNGLANSAVFHVVLDQKYTVVNFSSSNYVVLGGQIGSGRYGEVYAAVHFHENNGVWQNQRCVVKTDKQPDFFIGMTNALSNACIHCDMHAESRLIGLIYNIKLGITIQQNSSFKTYIAMPVLGDLNLDDLFQNPGMIHAIPVSEWIKFFFSILEKLEEFHKIRHIHNDIKPENIGLSLDLSTNIPRFTRVNLYDVGRAHKFHEAKRGSFSSYHPLTEGVLGIFSGSYKNTKYDIYCMGLCLLEIVNKLLAVNQSRTDCEKLQCCKTAFSQMTVWFQSSRPALNDTLKYLYDHLESIREVIPMRELIR